jgi:hypothetical protein
MSFKTIRIIVLLAILFFVGMNAWLTKLRTTDWDSSLWVALYPINGDGSQRSSDYIASLEGYEFEAIEAFMDQEAVRYNLQLNHPVTIKMAPEVRELPPKPPINGSILHIMWWSLRLRYWVYKVDTYNGPAPNIRLFLVYHDPNAHRVLDHSLGLQKGLIGIVNVFAGRNSEATNNVVITHELLHTVGAADKYDLSNGMPLYPDGYAEPDRDPRYPQNAAEIMGGRIPISETKFKIPESLEMTIIGSKTGEEINWVR